jgi:hypothetical protein
MKVAINTRNVELNALAVLLAGGTLAFYTGTQPATPETAVTGTLLGTLTLASPAFGAAAGGVITANAITGDLTADADGTAGYYRAWKSDGVTAVLDGSVGVSGADCNLNSIEIRAGADIEVTSWTITLPT